MDNLGPVEKKILRFLNKQEHKRFRPNQLVEWALGKCEVHPGEKIFDIAALPGIQVAIKLDSE